MKDEKETKARLLMSAKQEFMQKGYQGASLRNICKNAGVTTGALYFFFRDKEELFDYLVQPVLEMVQNMMEAHMKQELLEVENGSEESSDDIGDDEYASRQIVHMLYENYDSVQLLLTKSQGSKMAGCIDAFVNLAEQNYRSLAAVQSAKSGVPEPDEYTIHWMAHMQIDAFVHLLTHEPDEEKALEHLQDVVRYLVAGWYALFDVEATPKVKRLEAIEKSKKKKGKKKAKKGKIEK